MNKVLWCPWNTLVVSMGQCMVHHWKWSAEHIYVYFYEVKHLLCSFTACQRCLNPNIPLNQSSSPWSNVYLNRQLESMWREKVESYFTWTNLTFLCLSGACEDKGVAANPQTAITDRPVTSENLCECVCLKGRWHINENLHEKASFTL